MKIRILSSAVMIGVLIGSVGCDVDLTRKRKKKERPDYLNQAQLRRDPVYGYQRAFTLWRVAHDTIADGLGAHRMSPNNKRVRTNAERAGWSLEAMAEYLPESKAKKLKEFIPEYEKIASRASYTSGARALLTKLKRLHRAIIDEFHPDRVPIVATALSREKEKARAEEEKEKEEETKEPEANEKKE